MKLLRNSVAVLTTLASPALLLVYSPATAADACKLEINSTDSMQFDKRVLAAPASCKQVTLTLRHSGKLPVAAMGHNWVLVSTQDLTAIANAGLSAGAAAEYVPAGDKRVLAHTKLIGGGQTTSVTFSTAGLKAGGDYSYLCTFPGHNALMRGKFKFG